MQSDRFRASGNPWYHAAALVCVFFFFFVAPALAQPTPQVGISEHLGQTIPLDQLAFTDEAGRPVQLASLFDKPVVLTLIYFGCPGICPRILDEVAHAADGADLTPGADYRLIAISFNPKDTPGVAAVRRDALIEIMRQKKPKPEAWRFLTGDEANIQRITSAVGFNYVPVRRQGPNGEPAALVDFTHPATVIFLSREGKIVRYLNGIKVNPAELELAVNDATVSRERSFIQGMTDICYTRDRATGRRQFAVDRVILAVTATLAIGLLVYVLRQGRKRKRLIGTHHEQ